MNGITINDAALARSIGSSDPKHLLAARALLNDPDGEFVLGYPDTCEADAPLVWREAEEEIEVICQRYGIGQR